MEDQLAEKLLIRIVLYQKKLYIPLASFCTSAVDIAAISTVGMHYNL
jgi:hypothetical protein